MAKRRTEQQLRGLLKELCKLPRETEWLEFKQNNKKPESIGEYVSALANSAALADKQAGYVVWGVNDSTHAIVGTKFDPQATKRGNEELANWLRRLLSPDVSFEFYELTDSNKRVVILEVPRAVLHPVRFQNEEYIRLGSYTKKLRDFPEKERDLWRILGTTPFEQLIARSDIADDDVLRLLDYPSYFRLLNIPLPAGKQDILSALREDGLIAESGSGTWDITNLGAALFAARLEEFPGLERKAMRVITYKGNSKVETIKEQVGNKGYASGFEGLITYINGLLPSNEALGKALRKTIPMYPELAVRELVANALIHQDFLVTGASPMVEIYTDRLEITNPGKPLGDPERFLDMPPRSRNEKLASLMRRLGVCEERGSGVDKVVAQLELYQLPPALFEVQGDNTIAALFAHKPLSKMDRENRVRACYQHACLKYVMRERMTNQSLRERFGIEKKNSAQASRIIKEAIEDSRVVVFDESAAPKYKEYVPYWAAPRT